MSSITFPLGHHSSGSSPSDHDTNGFYPPPSFDSNSSFQMNPLSSHPPRTPRASLVVAHSHVYGTNVYENGEEKKEQSVVDEGEDEEDKVQHFQPKVRKEDVWREIIITSVGRDKAFKLIQYSIRVYLFFHFSLSTSPLLRKTTRPLWEKEFTKRLASTASGLSFTRKCLLLFNWLTPLTTIMAQQTVPYSSERSSEGSKPSRKPLIYAALYAPPPVLLDLVNSVSDDIATCSKLGLLGKRTGERAGRFSDWCWFIGTLVGLVENGLERSVVGNLQREVESRLYTESMSGATAKSKPTASKIDDEELSRLRTKDYWLRISRAKLVMDLIFVSYDVFKIKRAAEPVKAITGLMAAILSSAKIYDRHKSALMKALIA
ncbi:hypothetical protein PILCRDRAFT_161426 [Piloderma croceum F 1598]|uniref:Uncharacterized protein n=1 Tax=Piloderma croceum (strain F 1598) TaxID=765440 RepID=A0A0C3GK84_PILCF|nr:hypothetical protein PILCRDRAFT_161426 [Piloderma croceum F 1598]